MRTIGHKNRVTYSSRSVLLTLLVLAIASAAIIAQEKPAGDPKAKYPRYKLIDLGTFGGPNGYFANPLSRVINSSGTAGGTADTTISDPFYPDCFSDCFVTHAFQWRKGPMTELESLPGALSSLSLWINDSGTVVGVSERGTLDPLTGFPNTDSVLWKDGEAVNIGATGGSASVPAGLNNRGQVVGAASNMVPDSFASSFGACGFGFPFMFFPSATQVHAFLWQHGVMRDLGTLGGPDSGAGFVNEAGQIAGESYTNATANLVTGEPTLHPFFWEHGKMIDIGSLGGNCGTAWWLNNRGQVVGDSNLTGDLHRHPFLWDRGVLKDLGTLEGNDGQAFSISDSGLVVGRADVSLQSTIHHAFLWKNGVMTDLGVLGDCLNSTAYSVNSNGQVVGDTGRCPNGGGPSFFSERGQPMVDINTLVYPASDIEVIDAVNINDRGEITGMGILPDGDFHAVMLVPTSKSAVPTNAATFAPRVSPPWNSAKGGNLPLGNPRSQMAARLRHLPEP